MKNKSDQQILRLITNTSFRNWCLGKASKEEKKYWRAWIAKSVDHQRAAADAKRIVFQLEAQKPVIPAEKKFRNWKKLDHKIKITQYSSLSDAGFNRSYSFGWMLTAAASLLLLVISFVTLESTDLMRDDKSPQNAPPDLQTTATDYGEQKLISLDSGTRITLNANSSLTFHDGWIFNDTVSVKLQGEAYFDVIPRAANEGPVFRVETVDGEIHVLGTRFVVNTWDKQTKVVLEKGSVAIERRNVDSKQQRKAILKPSELAQFSRLQSNISIKKVDPSLFTSWTKGLFVFERDPLTVVAHRIEKIFGKKVIIADPELMTERVSGAVENDDLDVLLSALSQTLQIRIIEQGDQIFFKNAVSEGSFNKHNTKQSES